MLAKRDKNREYYIVFMYRKINFCLIELKFGVKLPRSQDGVEMWDFEKKTKFNMYRLYRYASNGRSLQCIHQPPYCCRNLIKTFFLIRYLGVSEQSSSGIRVAGTFHRA